MAVFLSASVPAKHSGFENARLDLNVDEAVITLARTIFAEGGKLVFGGHPSISPLVLTIASEYVVTSDVEAPLAFIYQSQIFREIIPKKTLVLEEMGYGRIVWTAAAEGEQLSRDEKTGRWLAPRSLERMRRAMISHTTPAAFVAIGGMEGVEQEADIFRELRPNAPVFAIESTGGASARLAETRQYVRAIDRSVADAISAHGWDVDRRPAALYPVVMEQLVAEIVRESQ
ncbi:MAG: hypothetical protein AABO58_18685 [Acidobacteriota bacterium]